ncbi:MAG: hypothetical protein ABI411_04615 [Tahibacter sp.]
MTKKPLKLSMKRIGVIAAPAIVALVVLIAYRFVRDRIQVRGEQIQKARSERLELYRMALEPCPAIDTAMMAEAWPALAPTEIAIDVEAAFSSGYGLRISGQSLQSYTGDNPFFDPPPASPTSSPENRPESLMRAKKPLEFTPAISLPPTLGEHLGRLLRSEIVEASAAHSSGADGEVYVFRYGKNCARTWSPLPETRAGKLTALVDALFQLSRASEDARSNERRKIQGLLDELQSDTLSVGG